MAEFKGGRGKKVGYQTEMYRIPSLLKPTISSLALQFRILWDGVADPKGEKLISRIKTAIPDCEQLRTSNGHNQISGKGETSKPDSKYKDEEDEPDEDELDEPDATNDQIIREQAGKNFKLLTENRMLERDLTTKQVLCNDRLAEIEQLRSQLASCRKLDKDATEQLAEGMSNGFFKAADILKEALKLKAGNGGAIKVKIKEALQLIDDI